MNIKLLRQYNYIAFIFFILTTSSFAQPKVPPTIAEALSKNTPQTVIIQFKDDDIQFTALTAAANKKIDTFDEAILAQMRIGYATVKARALKSLPKGITKKIDYHNLPMVTVDVSNSQAMAELVARPDVVAVFPNIRRKMTLAESLPQIKAPTAHALGKKGAGTSVAVLDTGTDYTRTAFGSCYGPNNPASTCRVAFAKDFAREDYARDVDYFHGTNVAGIIVGVAPSTKILALDVFNGKTAVDSDIINAINWVIGNKTVYNIVAMNLSLGGGSFTTECSNSPYTTAFANARNVGIIPVVATGNESNAYSIAAPACVPGAVRVGAVDISDRVTSFSNSAPNMVTLLAPGVEITSAEITMQGTSQATPHVAGAIALLRAPNAFPNDKLKYYR